MIKYLKHIEIDKTKWDNCIENADNGLIYAYSWYLDIVSPNWDALVMDDYEAVMPLPWRKKYGIKYIFQPYFTQQLGVYSILDSIDIATFISAIPGKFRLVELNLNERNTYDNNILKENANYKLDISSSYHEITKRYNRNCKRNIKKSEQAGFQISSELDSKEFVRFIKANLEEQIKDVGNSVWKVLEAIILGCKEKAKADLLGLYDSRKQLQAVGFFLKNKDRLIFSVCASTNYGKQNQAMYLLVDSQIKKYAGIYKWYDFSGSNIKGIAYFNSAFGALSENYLTLKINRLPSLLKLLKR